MLILRVSPYLVLILAVKLVFRYFIIFHMLRGIPSLCITYIIASSHAFSYAFVTSRKAMYAGLCFGFSMDLR